MTKQLSALVGAFLLLVSGAVSAQVVPTVTLTASPNSGSGSVATTLTWSSTGATSCTASGGWTGSKALSGTQTMAAVTVDTTYTLTCTNSNGVATLSWTPPTTRTDGSPLTNLAQYRIYAGPSATNMTMLQQFASGGSTRQLSGLSGLTFFAMSSLDANGVEGPRSSNVSATFAAQSASASATVDVTAPPSPPGGLSVSQPTAYEFQPFWLNSFKLVKVGTVAIGTACDESYKVVEKYYALEDQSAATLTRKYKGGTVLAVCA